MWSGPERQSRSKRTLTKVSEPAKCALVATVPREQLRALFEIFDGEKSGYIEPRELKAALRSLGVPISVQDLRELLKNVGHSYSDAISFEDFCSIAESRLPAKNSEEGLRQTFALFGGEELGYITMRHLRQACQELNEEISDSELQQMIKEADSDGDGRVTFADFVRIMRLHSDVLLDDDDETGDA